MLYVYSIYIYNFYARICSAASYENQIYFRRSIRFL